MDSSQVTGASSSYARKYALNGLFCIDDNKDSDTTNTYGKENQQNQQVQKSQQQAQSQTQNQYYCEQCGKEFTGFKTKNRNYTPLQEYKSRKQKYGKALCNDCLVLGGFIYE